MSTVSNHDATRFLHAWSQGDEEASARLLPLIYDHLRHLAREYLRRERAGHTLQPTALVHEAYLRLVDGSVVQWRCRAHFFALAATAMRRILVEHARSRQALKRGGHQQRVPFEEAEVIGDSPGEGPDLVALDEALGRLAVAFPRPSRVVELRFFGGMETGDIAEHLQVSDKTVQRDWQFAKLWLHRELEKNGRH